MVDHREQPTHSRRKQCPRCGAQFGCAHPEPGCWCESLLLRRETLAEIRALADDCLCPACLTGFALRKRDSVPDAPDPGVLSAATRSVTAIPRAVVRARGVPPAWGRCVMLCVVDSLLLALAIGPISIGTARIARSRLSHLALLDRGQVIAEGRTQEVLSEANVAAYYGVNVRVIHEDDHIVLLPQRQDQP